MIILANPYFWAVVASAVLSGYFGLVSISLRAFRKVEIEEAFGGDARRVERLERHLPALRLMAGFLRSLLNLMLAVAMVYLLADLFGVPHHDWGTAMWAVLAAGGLMGVVGVAIPNAWAPYGGEKMLARTMGVLLALRYALWPVLAVLGAFETPVRRLSGVSASDAEPPTVKEEILHAASEAEAQGAVEREEVRMIHSVMRLGDLRAGDIMTPRTAIFALPADTPCSRASRQVAAAGHSRVPVYDGNLDNLLGILYAKDLLRQAGAPGAGAVVDASSRQPRPDAGPPPEEPAIRSILRQPFFVPPTKPLDDLLREFRARKVHLAVVQDEYGGTAGMVTIEDVLEEIVGEIADEHERPAPALIRRIDARTAEIDGRTTLEALNETLGLDLPLGEDYVTAAGLVLAELGYIPTAGEALLVGSTRFKVLAATPKQITRLRVEVGGPAPAAPTAAGQR